MIDSLQVLMTLTNQFRTIIYLVKKPPPVLNVPLRWRNLDMYIRTLFQQKVTIVPIAEQKSFLRRIK